MVVGKPQGFHPGQIHLLFVPFFGRFIDLLRRHAGPVFLVKDGHVAGARVFHVQVDVSLFEGFGKNRFRTESRLHFHIQIGVGLDHFRHQMGQDPLLGPVLSGDDHLAGVCLVSAGGQQEDQKKEDREKEFSHGITSIWKHSFAKYPFYFGRKHLFQERLPSCPAAFFQILRGRIDREPDDPVQ